MKKKLLPILTATGCAIACAFGLAACNNDGGHTHDYGTEWKTDATYHWHECTASGDCDAKEKDKAEHADANSDGKCDVCDYAMPIAVTGISLNKSTLTLDVGGDETLIVTFTPDNATDKTVTWSSSAPTIATVDDTGKVTAVAAGTATITATTANNKTATCAVTVNTPAPTTEVTEDEWRAALSQSAFVNFTATMEFEGQSVVLKADLENGKWCLISEDSRGVQENYYEKTAEDAYYQYLKTASDSGFIRSETDEDGYGVYMNYEFMAVIYYAHSYSSFTYDSEDESYKAQSITALLGEYEWTYDVTFKFESGKLIYALICEPGENDGIPFTYTYGDTTITLPTEYSETVAGKTFVFSGCTDSNGNHETVTEQYNSGTTVEFGSDGTGAQKASDGSVGYSFAYTQAGNLITITMNSVSGTFTYDATSGTLVTYQENEGETYTITYILQTEATE